MASRLKQNLVVSSGTAVSRLTGLVRVAVLGAVLGTPSAVADAYDLANGTPNMVYELMIGGVLSAGLTPLLTQLRHADDEEGTSAVMTVSTIALVAFTVVAVLAAPFIFHLYSLMTSSSVDAAQYRRVGGSLARIFLVQIFFYGINALATSALNANRRFTAASWFPALSNLVIIVSLLMVPTVAHHRAPTLSDLESNTSLRLLLGWGATVGIAVMALSLAPLALRNQQRLRLLPSFRHPAVARLRTMTKWALGFAVTNQITLVFVRNLLRGGSGDMFAYSRAQLWFMLPHALLAMSITTTFLPDMTKLVIDRKRRELIEQSSLGVRLIALVTIPAGFGLFVLRRSIIGAVFQHGHASAADALLTSRALAGFSLGLAGFSIYMFSLRVFYAHQDTRSPFVINTFENIVNIVLGIVLSHYFGIIGLAASFAIAYVVSAIFTMHALAYRLHWFDLRRIYTSIARMIIASVLMAEFVWGVARTVGANAGLGAVVRVGVGTVLGTAVYVTVLRLLGSEELTLVTDRLRKVGSRS